MRAQHLPLAFVILTIAFAISNVSVQGAEPEKGNANEFMDKLLVNVREMILEKNFDPYKAIDFNFLATHLTGKLHGLSSLHRGGQATLKTLDDGTIEIDCVFSVYSLKADFNYAVKVILLTINGKANGVVDEVKTRIVLKTDINTKKLTITKFKVTEVGRIKTDVQVPLTVPFINRIVSLVTDAIANMFKNIVVKLLEGNIRNIVQQTLSSMVLIP